MQKSTRLTLTGSVQGIFFKNFIKENAEKHNVKGYLRQLENGKIEIFIEGLTENVDSLIAICKRGPQHAQIRSAEEKEEHFQDFKEFKILSF
jgi:acylphosphatase